jgi:hypothetical protein
MEHGEFADTLETEQAVNQQDGVFGGDFRVHEDDSRLLAEAHESKGHDAARNGLLRVVFEGMKACPTLSLEG